MDTCCYERVKIHIYSWQFIRNISYKFNVLTIQTFFKKIDNLMKFIEKFI